MLDPSIQFNQVCYNHNAEYYKKAEYCRTITIVVKKKATQSGTYECPKCVEARIYAYEVLIVLVRLIRKSLTEFCFIYLAGGDRFQ